MQKISIFYINVAILNMINVISGINNIQDYFIGQDNMRVQTSKLEIDDETADYFTDANDTDMYKDEYTTLSKNNIGSTDYMKYENQDIISNFQAKYNNKGMSAAEINQNLVECNHEHNEVMILEDDIVQVSYYLAEPPDIWIEKCRTNLKVETNFSVALTVTYPEIYVYYSKWTAIPESAVVETMYMKNATPIGEFGGCSKLTLLDIDNPNLRMISKNWLSNCTQLSNLKISHVNVSQLRTILDSVVRVKEVSIRFLYSIANIVFTPIFPSTRGVHQWITNLSIDNYGVEDDVKNADVTSESLLWQLSQLRQLEKLKLDSINYMDFCALHNISTMSFESLLSLTLYYTATSKFCFKRLRKMPKLLSFHIAQRRLDVFEFGELFSATAPTIKVDLTVDHLNEFVFTRADYLSLTAVPSKSNITLIMDKEIICDCNTSLWLVRAILDGVVSASRITCFDGTSLTEQRCDYLYCERIKCESDCVCCLDGPGTYIEDCRNANISSFPPDINSSSNLTALLAPKNSLTTLPSYLPKNLTWLDLTGNNLLRNSTNAELTSLFEVPDRHMILSGNPIICSCDSQYLIDQLQKRKTQIEDYESLVCAGDNTKISEVDVSSLCTFRNRQRSVIASVSLLLILSLAVLLIGGGFYYRQSIKIFLYARGWCLFCIKEEEMDADRPYDVFISFCHEDGDVVMEEIVPVLDQDYSVCVHYRDWRPGDMIPAQITRSVEQSRRTMVVVSRNFVKSLWGLLEFRTAHVTGLLEGRVRVVMVVLDDVLDEDGLEGELKAYVRLNTYVRWGDPWFWDKLKFALPHNPRHPKPSQHNYAFQDDQPFEMLEMYNVNLPSTITQNTPP